MKKAIKTILVWTALAMVGTVIGWIAQIIIVCLLGGKVKEVICIPCTVVRGGVVKHTYVPTTFPYCLEVESADNKLLDVVVEDNGDYYGLWLEIPSTGKKAEIFKFTTVRQLDTILGEIERKYEAVFAHVVHHRQTIPYTPGEHIYYDLPPFP